MTTKDKSPERVSNEELAEIDAAATALHDTGEAARLPTIARVLAIGCRLAAEVRALREPVHDIGAALAAIKVASNRYDLEIWKQMIRSHVERAAVLARENAELRTTVLSLRKHRDALDKRCEDEHEALDAANAEVERLKQEIRSLQTYDRGDLL
jgi:chromosome segregation ATPase